MGNIFLAHFCPFVLNKNLLNPTVYRNILREAAVLQSFQTGLLNLTMDFLYSTLLYTITRSNRTSLRFISKLLSWTGDCIMDVRPTNLQQLYNPIMWSYHQCSYGYLVGMSLCMLTHCCLPIGSTQSGHLTYYFLTILYKPWICSCVENPSKSTVFEILKTTPSVINRNFLNLCHRALMVFSRGKGIQFSTIKVYLIKCPVSVFHTLSPIRN